MSRDAFLLDPCGREDWSSGLGCSTRVTFTAGKCLHIACTESGADGQNGAQRGSSRHKRNTKEKRRNPSDDKGFGAVRQPLSPSGNHRQKVEAAGIEREVESPQSTTGQEFAASTQSVSAYCLHSECSECHCMAQTDATLRRLIRVWPELPESTKRAINAICVDALLFDV